MRVLVDTSVWSEALRRRKKLESDPVRELRSLILEHRVEILGPIRQEILSGLREEAQFERLEKQIAAFPDIVLETADYTMAAKCFNTCRAQGVQGSNTDFLICAAAVRRDLAIFTTDKDFPLFAKHLPIVLHRIREYKPDKSSKPGKPRR
ncbi:MAG: PIN domain-containing protein [Verrucomicrobia bacterium]|nr:PIN domain-containing protein [Verrucomicrobiota bacterium]MCH8528887.1 PIN domain-containing protein [Kiritimatiellia bacterium]